MSDACVSYSTLENLNRKLQPSLTSITKETDFFAYYRLNLYNKQCPFWDDSNGMCGNIACAVNTLENEEDIPPIWRADALGRLEGPKAGHPGKELQEERGPERPLQGMLGDNVRESCVMEYDDECDQRDYCVPEDESATAKGDYVSLVDNPERFTGYSGDGAKQVWDAVYRENCFSRASFPHAASQGMPQGDLAGPAALGLKSVLRERARQEALAQQQKYAPNTPFVAETGMEYEDECLEKRVFYRIISGMHASISTHLCWDYLNQYTGEWGPNMTCYIERLHSHPERISNLFFNFALLLRAVTKIGPSLQSYSFCSGDPVQDAATSEKVQNLTTQLILAPQNFDESLMFVNGEGPNLKEDFRNRFRNISRIMDCVGCDKCRLWGKVQTAGYGAALKILFEFDNAENGVEVPLKRTELIALFNTLARISSSISALEGFKAMTKEQERGSEKYQESIDKLRLPSHAVTVQNKGEGERGLGEQAAVSHRHHDDFNDYITRNGDLRKESSIHRTVLDDIKSESILVWKAFKFVIKGWINFPGTM